MGEFEDVEDDFGWEERDCGDDRKAKEGCREAAKVVHRRFAELSRRSVW